MPITRIGYQGQLGSNAEVAARRMAERLGYTEAEYVPLLNSRAVISELRRHAIDLAVVAVQNSLGGIVTETSIAVDRNRTHDLEWKRSITLHIHHFLYKLPGVPAQSIDTIASHPQALKQTARNRALLFPHCREVPMEDTAIAARNLAEGTLPRTTAVLCRQEAGEMYDLELVRPNMEDEQDNYTVFWMYCCD